MTASTREQTSVFVCTGNAGKLAEFRSCFGSEVDVVGLGDLESRAGVRYVEPQEDADDFLLNAWTKALAAHAYLEECALRLGVPARSLAHGLLVDDSGLCVPLLGYAPGVHSATYGGLPRDDAKNRAALRAALRRAGREEADAFFVCYLLWVRTGTLLPTHAEFLGTLSQREHAIHRPLAAKAAAELVPCGGIFERLEGVEGGGLAFGFCTGSVRTEEQQLIPGAGHGYDALFYPVGNPTRSFASITMDEKNTVSHRAQALRAALGGHGSTTSPLMSSFRGS